MFEICYSGGNSGEGFSLAHSLGGRDIVVPRSAEQGGMYNGYGQNTMPSTVYNMFAEGDTRREGTIIDYSVEMQRWFDIMRFDKGTEILAAKGWTEKYRYFPICQSEIDKSNGGLTQNQAWL